MMLMFDGMLMQGFGETKCMLNTYGVTAFKIQNSIPHTITLISLRITIDRNQDHEILREGKKYPND